MTSAVTAAPRPVPGAVRRVLDIARIQTFHATALLKISLGLLVAGPLVLVALTVALEDVVHPLGDVVYPLRTGLLLGLCCAGTLSQLQMMMQTFPLVLGLGRTRRAFAVAMLLAAAVQAAVHATVLTLLVQVELATGGWGLAREVLALGPLRRLSAPEQWVVLAAALLVVAMASALFAVMQTRWGQSGIWMMGVLLLVGTVVVGLLMVIVVLLVVQQFGRPGAEALVAAGSSVPLLAGGPLALAVVLGLAAFAVLRRTAP